MIKKILTFLLCITLLCPLFANAYDVEERYFEIAEYNEAVQFLSAFGILNRENQSLDTSDWTITRGEFVYLALLSLGYEQDMQTSAFDNPFRDVSHEHPYAKAITYAANTNLLGDIGRFFQPDIPLTMEFAARLGVNMTGRDVMLGTKNTYLKLAISAHLFDKVEMYGKSELSRGGALQFLKNVLTAPVVTYNSISTNGEKGDIRVEENANLLSTVLKYEKRRGILTSDGLTTVFGSTPEEGYISVDAKRYLLLSGSATGMAGRYVEYYITDYEGEAAVKYIEEYRNDVMILDAASITAFDPITMKYHVLIEGKGRDLAVSRSAYISYNHEPYYNPDYMKPHKGTVSFIDHNSDNVYDVVMVQEFTNTIVDYYSSYSETIYDLDSREDAVTKKNIDDIDLSDSKNIFLTGTDNKFVEVGLLEKYSIISVYKSIDSKKVRMIVSTEKITGNLNVIDDEGFVTIGSREYKLSADFRSDKNLLELGSKYTCYLDARGEIAYMTTETGVMAYLTNAGLERTISDNVQLQALDEESGTLNIYQLAKKVKFKTPSTDIKIKRKDLYESYLKNASDEFIRTMALLDFNDAGEVSAITTAMDIPTYDALTAAPEYPLYKLSYLITGRPTASGGDATGKGMEYRDVGDHWNRWIVMGSGAKIFYVPEDGEEIDDPESIVVKKASYSDGNNEDADLGFYSKDKNEIAVRYLLKHGKASAAATIEKSWPYVVSKIVGCYDDKRGDTYRITLEGTDTRTLYLKNVSVLKKENWAPETDLTKIPEEKTQIEVGDIVFYSTDASGDIDQFLVWWNSRDGLSNSDVSRFGNVALITPPERYDKIGPAGCLIERKDGSILEVSLDDLSEEKNTPLADRIQRVNWGKNMSTIMVQYTGKRAEITRDISATELIPGDRIVLCGRYGDVYVSVVYRR